MRHEVKLALALLAGSVPGLASCASSPASEAAATPATVAATPATAERWEVLETGNFG